MTNAAPQPLPEDVRQQAIPALAQTVALLLALRRQDPPAPWPVVYKALGLSLREVKRYRWLIAAELYAVNGSWTDTARNPAVDFNADTVRKDHATAKLPGGLTWAGYVADYQRAYQARLSELQQERGEDDAEVIASLGRRSLGVLGQLQTRIEQCVSDPPDHITVSNTLTIPGRQGYVSQMKIGFELLLAEAAQAPVPVPSDPDAAPQLSIEAARYLLGAQQEVLSGLEKASRLLTGLPQQDSSGADEPAAQAEFSAEEIETMIKRTQAKAAELAALARRELEAA